MMLCARWSALTLIPASACHAWVVPARAPGLLFHPHGQFAGAWFAISLVAVFLSIGLTVACYVCMRRTRQAEAAAAAVVAEAGALNDALLQNFQGLLLTFHSAATCIADDQTAKTMFMDAFKMADSILMDGVVRFERLSLRPGGKAPAKEHPVSTKR